MNTYLDRQIQALGDPTRRAIFEAVTRKPAAVGRIAAHFPISRPAVSQHLKVLKDCGLVVDARIGNARVYRSSPEALARLQRYFERFRSRALAAFDSDADRVP